MLCNTLRSLLLDRRGTSALEVSLLAPLLVLGLLSMADMGLGIGARMELDRVVRSGVQAALSLNNDAAAIQTLALAASASPEGLEVEVQRVCACAAAVTYCTATCGGGAPSVYYDIAALRRHDGLIFGDWDIASRTRIKIR